MSNELEKSDRVDELEVAMLEHFPVAECPIIDHFTDGIYGREMRAKQGTLITSKIHLTNHLFILLKGKIALYFEDEETVYLTAPYIGITKAGTRRVGYVLQDVSWLTIHANPNDETVEQIEDRIIDKHENKLLTEEMKNKLSYGVQV